MEKKKYIIELEEDQYTIRLLKIKNGEKWPQCDFMAVTPYTEPDIDAIRNEAYEDGYKTAKVQCSIQAEKDLREVGERHYQKGYQDATAKISSDEQAIAEKAYQSGLNDTWKAVRKIALPVGLGGIKASEVKKIFGVDWQYVLMNCTPATAIEKILQYEQEKEQIHVGDVVRVKNAPEVEIWVTYISDEDGGLLSGLALKTVGDNCDIGDTYANRNIYNFERTGKHFDVSTVLEKMRGEKDG